MLRVRVGKHGVIVLPKEVRERLGIEEGSVLELSVEGDRIIMRVADLWSELRGRRMRVDVDEAEESWLRRLGR